MAEEEVFLEARDWEKEMEDAKSEVTKAKKKALSWEREAHDIRKLCEREKKLKVEAIQRERTVESEGRRIRRELEDQLKHRDEIILQRNAEIADLKRTINGSMCELKREKERNIYLEKRVCELGKTVEEWQQKDYELKEKEHQERQERERREKMMKEVREKVEYEEKVHQEIMKKKRKCM